MSECEKSVDFWVEELIKDTTPSHFDYHEKFMSYMKNDKINSFGKWMFNNGYNTGLVNLQTKVNTYCIPQWMPHETTTFKPIATDARGYACQFSCSACDCVVSRSYYNYCPYCGRPVESEDAK